MTQTSQNQFARQREWELQQSLHNNREAPGMRDLLEYARLKSTDAHAQYIRSGPSERLHAQERQWLELIKTIEEGPHNKQLPVEG